MVLVEMITVGTLILTLIVFCVANIYSGYRDKMSEVVVVGLVFLVLAVCLGSYAVGYYYYLR